MFKVPVIGCQWFYTAPLDSMFYVKQIAPSRTFCIYEEVGSSWLIILFDDSVDISS